MRPAISASIWLERRHVGDLDFNSGGAFAEFEQGAGNQAVYGGHAHAQTKLSQLAAGGCASGFKSDFDVADDPAALFVEHGAGGSKRNPAPVADEKRPANLFFQALDALAQRGLRNMEARRGPAEVQLLGEHGERSQILRFQVP